MKHPMTPRGYNALRRELTKLKAQRPELALAIEVARAHGDLKENGDYDAAKAKSGMVEARIRDAETRLSQAEVIDPLRLANLDRVVFGVSVQIEDVDSGEKRKLSIYGSQESDIEKGWISYESPLGKALIGKQVGEVTRVALPSGAREYEILDILVDYTEELLEEE